MNKIIARLILITFTSVSLLACQTTSSARSQINETLTIVKSPTQLQIPTLPSATPIPIKRKTPTPKTLTQSCAKSPVELEPHYLSSGKLIFRKNREVWTLDPNLSEPQLLFNEDPGLLVSPFTGSFSWFSNTNIFFRDAVGLQFSLSRPKEMTLVVQWLQNDRLLLRVSTPDDFVSLRPAKDELYEVDFSSSQVIYHSLEMFGFFARGLTLNYFRSSPIYDPNFRVAFYAWRGEPEFRNDGMLLWDIQEQRVLWKSTWSWPIERTGYDWSLDGSHLVVAGPNNGNRRFPELISISVDGTATQLSNLREMLHNFDDYQVLVTKWSPDERYIAFVVLTNQFNPLEDRYLYLFNTATAEIIDFCLPLVQGSLDMYWSPNSKQIAFTTDADQSLIVLEVETAQTWRVTFDDNAQVFALYGWIK